MNLKKGDFFVPEFSSKNIRYWSNFDNLNKTRLKNINRGYGPELQSVWVNMNIFFPDLYDIANKFHPLLTNYQ